MPYGQSSKRIKTKLFTCKYKGKPTMSLNTQELSMQSSKLTLGTLICEAFYEYFSCDEVLLGSQEEQSCNGLKLECWLKYI